MELRIVDEMGRLVSLRCLVGSRTLFETHEVLEVPVRELDYYRAYKRVGSKINVTQPHEILLCNRNGPSVKTFTILTNLSHHQ